MRQESVEYLQKIADYVETRAEESMITGVLFVDLYVEVYMLATPFIYTQTYTHSVRKYKQAWRSLLQGGKL